MNVEANLYINLPPPSKSWTPSEVMFVSAPDQKLLRVLSACTTYHDACGSLLWLQVLLPLIAQPVDLLTSHDHLANNSIHHGLPTVSC